MDLLFTTKHLYAVIMAVFVIILLIYIMDRLKLESKKLIVFTAVLFYVFEVLKQGYWVYSGIFSVKKLPLYPCNMPLYIMPLSIFGSEKIKEFLKPFLYVIFVGGGVLTLAYPSIILGTSSTWTPQMQNFVPFLSVVAHGCMVGVGLYLLTSGYYKIRRYDFIRIFVVIFTAYLFVYLFNKGFDTDFFFSNYGDGLPRFLIDIKGVSELLFASLVFLSGLMILYSTYFVTLFVNKIMNNRFSKES